MLKSDFDQWRTGVVGKWFFDEVLTKEITRRDQAIGSGSALSNDPYELAINYAQEVGISAGIDLVHALDPFKEERNETESNGPTSPG